MSMFSMSPGRSAAAGVAQDAGSTNGLPAGAVNGHMAASYAMDPMSMFANQVKQEQMAQSLHGLSQIVGLLALHHLQTQQQQPGAMPGQTPALTPSPIHSPFVHNQMQQNTWLQNLLNMATPGMGAGQTPTPPATAGTVF